MKLIMITDLKGVGKKGEVINANDGLSLIHIFLTFLN